MDATHWGLTFLRLYVGFDLVPHFTEKLFAGSAPRLEDIAAFQSLGLSGAFCFVLAAALCELGIAIWYWFGLSYAPDRCLCRTVFPDCNLSWGSF